MQESTNSVLEIGVIYINPYDNLKNTNIPGSVSEDTVIHKANDLDSISSCALLEAYDETAYKVIMYCMTHWDVRSI